MCSVHTETLRVSNLLAWELQVVMSYHMGAENQTQILDKSATYIELYHIMAYHP